MRPVLKSPRVLRIGSPLTLEGIREVCPAIFAEGPHESRGPRYRYVPTIEPLQKMLDNGWGVYEASQQKVTKDKTRNGYTKHMLRLRKLEDFTPKPAVVGDGVGEVIMINAHDGTSRYHMKGGFFRFVCSNGMMVGSHIVGFSIVHSTGKQTSQEVLEAGERIVLEGFPRMLENIEQFKSIRVGPEKQYRLANKALALRYGEGALSPFPASDLLTVRRPEDEEPTLWNVLNRVQEGIMYGGWKTKSIAFGRASTVRPVESVSAVVKINSGIWDEADAIAKEAA